MFSQLPLDEQLDAFRAAISKNHTLVNVLNRAATIGLPDWYLAGGCLFQTVWNVLTGRPPAEGIKDYDLFYFDADTSWAAEDTVIQMVNDTFANLTADVEVRNQARVHLWYETKFGVSCPPHRTTEDGIDTFIATTCCLGLRLETPSQHWRVYAPYGLADVLNLTIRPNPVLAPRSAYDTKVARAGKINGLASPPCPGLKRDPTAA